MAWVLDDKSVVGGASISPCLGAFKTDLFLSANENDVQEVFNANILFDDRATHTDPESKIVPSAKYLIRNKRRDCFEFGVLPIT